MSEPKIHVTVIFSTTSKVRLTFRDRPKIDWLFYDKRDPKRLELTDKKFTKISDNTFGCGSNRFEDVVEHVQQLCTMYDAPVFELQIDPSELHHLGTILSTDVLRKTGILIVDQGTVSHEEMRQILGGFVSCPAMLWCSPEPGFTYDRTISNNIILMRNASWFKPSMLSNVVGSKVIECENSCDITDEHLNMFLRKWLNNTTGWILNRFVIYPQTYFGTEVYDDTRPRKLDLEKIVQGLESFEHKLTMPLYMLYAMGIFSHAAFYQTTNFCDATFRNCNVLQLICCTYLKMFLQTSNPNRPFILE